MSVDLRQLANRIRLRVVEMSHRGRSSHVGSSLSMADLLAVLYGRILRIRPDAPDDPERDRLILTLRYFDEAPYDDTEDQSGGDHRPDILRALWVVRKGRVRVYDKEDRP